MVVRAAGKLRKEQVGRAGLAPQNSADSRTDLTYQRFVSRDWFLGYVQAAAREQSDKNLPNRKVRDNSGCLFGLRVGYVYCSYGSVMTLIQPRRLWKPNPEPDFQIWDQLRDARVNLSCPHLEHPCR